MNMEMIGWNVFFDLQFQSFKDQGLLAGRILKEVRHLYTVSTTEGVLEGEVSGRFHFTAMKRSNYPTVGDWVAIRRFDDFAIIEEVLPRKSAFSRKTAGNKTQEQVVAANIDHLCIVCGLDGGRNFNLRGIERYVAMTVEGGAAPVIILNKVDLSTDREGVLLKARSIAGDIPVHMVSALTGEGMDSLAKGFGNGSTVAFTGRSGVGKSSLINCLLRRAVLKTGDVREGDLRGRHTTTHKEIFFLEGGAMVIDTPGMRELQLWGDEASLEETYGEIYEASRRCQFADCSHQNEPGCAVQELLVDGSLDIGRYENYLEMRAELRFLETKINEKKRLERKGREKELSKLIRKFKKNR
jgi:ribosome biogenesis GTPase